MTRFVGATRKASPLQDVPSPLTYEQALAYRDKPQSGRQIQMSFGPRQVRVFSIYGTVILLPGGLVEVQISSVPRREARVIADRLTHIIGYPVSTAPSDDGFSGDEEQLFITLPAGTRRMERGMLIRQPSRYQRRLPVGEFVASLCPRSVTWGDRKVRLTRPPATVREATERLLELGPKQLVLAAGMMAKMARPPIGYTQGLEETGGWSWDDAIDRITTLTLAGDAPQLTRLYGQLQGDDVAVPVRSTAVMGYVAWMGVIALQSKPLFSQQRIEEFVEATLALLQVEPARLDYYGFPRLPPDPNPYIDDPTPSLYSFAPHFLGLWWDRVQCMLPFVDVRTADVSGRVSFTTKRGGSVSARRYNDEQIAERLMSPTAESWWQNIVAQWWDAFGIGFDTAEAAGDRAVLRRAGERFEMVFPGALGPEEQRREVSLEEAVVWVKQLLDERDDFLGNRLQL